MCASYNSTQPIIFNIIHNCNKTIFRHEIAQEPIWFLTGKNRTACINNGEKKKAPIYRPRYWLGRQGGKQYSEGSLIVRWRLRFPCLMSA